MDNVTAWQENPFVSENHFFQVSDERQSRILECLLSNRESPIHIRWSSDRGREGVPEREAVGDEEMRL